MTATQLHTWKKLLSFWLLIAFFALSWGGLLFFLSFQIFETSQLNQVPAQIQALYISGLYCFMLWLCHKSEPQKPLRHNLWQNSKYFLQGSLISMISLTVVWGIFILLNWAQAKAFTNAYQIWIQNLFMALAIAWIEERIFRGYMLSRLNKIYSWRKAIHIQAFWYALLHLLRGDLSLISWLTALIGLSLTGILLGHLRQRNQSLLMGFGLHACWIWLCSSIDQVSMLSWNTQYKLWTGQGNPVYGISGSLLIILLLLLFPLSNSLTQQDNLCNNESTT